MAGRRSGIKGVNRLRRTLRRLPDAVTEDIRNEIIYAAKLVHATALQTVPAKTGNLASLLSWKTSRDGLSARIGFIGRKATRKGFYARFLEFGTARTAARPFLFPALESERDHIVKRLRRAVRKTLIRVSNGR